jgi:hypothetical protein
MKKSNLLHFRTNHREQKTKDRRQKGKVITFPKKQLSDGELIFRYGSQYFLIRRRSPGNIDKLYAFLDSLTTESHAS